MGPGWSRLCVFGTHDRKGCTTTASFTRARRDVAAVFYVRLSHSVFFFLLLFFGRWTRAGVVQNLETDVRPLRQCPVQESEMVPYQG